MHSNAARLVCNFHHSEAELNTSQYSLTETTASKIRLKLNTKGRIYCRLLENTGLTLEIWYSHVNLSLDWGSTLKLHMVPTVIVTGWPVDGDEEQTNGLALIYYYYIIIILYYYDEWNTVQVKQGPIIQPLHSVHISCLHRMVRVKTDIKYLNLCVFWLTLGYFHCC